MESNSELQSVKENTSVQDVLNEPYKHNGLLTQDQQNVQKHIIYCNNCMAKISGSPDESQSLTALLQDYSGITKPYHFHNQSCYAQFIQKKSFGSIEVDIAKKEVNFV